MFFAMWLVLYLIWFLKTWMDRLKFDWHDLSRIIKEEIGQIDNVSAVNSVMTLKTFKESTKIPLDTK